MSSPPQGQDARRSRRFRTRLEADLAQGNTTQRVYSVDVSRHGVFLATPSPPRERFLVRVTLYLPDGPLEANGFVSRSVAPSPGREGGVGLQFFAMGEPTRKRWDAFITWLSGSGAASDVDDGFATFVIKLPDVDKLRDLVDRALRSSNLYIMTPLLRPVGSAVAVVLVHPESQAEFVLKGRVARVRIEQPRGLEVAADPVPASDYAALGRFLIGGDPYAATPLPVLEPVPRSGTPPASGWPDGRPRSLGELPPPSTSPPGQRALTAGYGLDARPPIFGGAPSGPPPPMLAPAQRPLAPGEPLPPGALAPAHLPTSLAPPRALLPPGAAPIASPQGGAVPMGARAPALEPLRTPFSPAMQGSGDLPRAAALDLGGPLLDEHDRVPVEDSFEWSAVNDEVVLDVDLSEIAGEDLAELTKDGGVRITSLPSSSGTGGLPRHSLADRRSSGKVAPPFNASTPRPITSAPPPPYAPPPPRPVPPRNAPSVIAELPTQPSIPAIPELQSPAAAARRAIPLPPPITPPRRPSGEAAAPAPTLDLSPDGPDDSAVPVHTSDDSASRSPPGRDSPRGRRASGSAGAEGAHEGITGDLFREQTPPPPPRRVRSMVRRADDDDDEPYEAPPPRSAEHLVRHRLASDLVDGPPPSDGRGSRDVEAPQPRAPSRDLTPGAQRTTRDLAREITDPASDERVSPGRSARASRPPADARPRTGSRDLGGRTPTPRDLPGAEPRRPGSDTPLPRIPPLRPSGAGSDTPLPYIPPQEPLGSDGWGPVREHGASGDVGSSPELGRSRDVGRTSSRDLSSTPASARATSGDLGRDSQSPPRRSTRDIGRGASDLPAPPPSRPPHIPPREPPALPPHMLTRPLTGDTSAPPRASRGPTFELLRDPPDGPWIPPRDPPEFPRGLGPPREPEPRDPARTAEPQRGSARAPTTHDLSRTPAPPPDTTAARVPTPGDLVRPATPTHDLARNPSELARAPTPTQDLARPPGELARVATPTQPPHEPARTAATGEPARPAFREPATSLPRDGSRGPLDVPRGAPPSRPPPRDAPARATPSEPARASDPARAAPPPDPGPLIGDLADPRTATRDLASIAPGARRVVVPPPAADTEIAPRSPHGPPMVSDDALPTWAAAPRDTPTAPNDAPATRALEEADEVNDIVTLVGTRPFPLESHTDPQPLPAALAMRNLLERVDPTLLAHPFAARLTCRGCGDETRLRVGHAQGRLAPFAGFRLYYCRPCRRFMPVLRLTPARERANLRAALDALDELPQIPLELAFDVADLARPPRCPTCASAVRLTKPLRALEAAVAELEAQPDTPIALDKLTCGRCDRVGLVLTGDPDALEDAADSALPPTPEDLEESED